MRSAWPAAVLASGAVFVLSWFFVQHGWYAHDQIIDTGVYQTYGAEMAAGRVPYRDFRPEYPPVALPVFLLPTGFDSRPNSDTYRRAFEYEMLGVGLALLLAVALALRRLERDVRHALSGLALVAISPLLIGSLILTRFDLWPTALAAAAIAALVWERESAGAIVLALAVAAKLWPAVLFPLALAWVWRRRGRVGALDFGALFGLVLGLCFLPFAIVAPGGFAHSFGEQLSRPLQVESFGSSVLMALHHLFGLRLQFESSHGSQNLAGGLADTVAALSTAAGIVALLTVWILFARGPAERQRLVAAAAGAVAVFIGFGKVFSPQFLIWLLAVVPLVRGLAARGLFTAAGVLTLTWFPHHYWGLALAAAEPQSWELLARNLCVLALAGTVVRRLQHEVLGEDRTLLEPLQPVRGQVEV